MKNIVGAKKGVCDRYGNAMVFLKVKGLGTISQCRKCSNTVSGRIKDTVQIYTYDFKEVK